MNNEKIEITWYGRCCFLIEIENTKILIDPHDTFDGIDIGLIKSDYTLISSTWHDHGHVGASPQSVIISEPGTFQINENLLITGIETKENRGTRNVIFNISNREFSITNFADLGDKKFLNKLNTKSKKILSKTNIAFARPNKVLESKYTSIDLALKSCIPQVLIPHHFYPPGFIEKTKGQFKKNANQTYLEFLKKIKNLPYEPQNIQGYNTIITKNTLQNKKILLIENLHPQVKQL